MGRASLLRLLPLAAVASVVLILALVAVPDITPARGSEPQGALALTKGDNDCDGDSDAVDALVALQYVAGFFYNQEPFCLELGFPINPLGGTGAAGIVPWVFGDIDCDFDVDAVDALLVLRVLAGLSINIPPPLLCPPFGAPY